jgi:hypothetical protein
MAEPEPPTTAADETATPPPTGARSKDEIALDLTKFIAAVTGYGKASQSSAGFSGKPSARTVEEHADALLELFERCRRVVRKEE